MSLHPLPVRQARRAPVRHAILVTGVTGAFVALEELDGTDDQLERRRKRLFSGQCAQLVALTVLEG